MSAKNRHAGETAKDNGKNKISEIAIQFGEITSIQVNKVAALWEKCRVGFCELDEIIDDYERECETYRKLFSLVRKADKVFAELKAKSDKVAALREKYRVGFCELTNA